MLVMIWQVQCLSIMARKEAPLLPATFSYTTGRVRMYSVLWYDNIIASFFFFEKNIIASLIALLHRTPGTYNNIGPKKLLLVCYHFGLLYFVIVFIHKESVKIELKKKVSKYCRNGDSRNLFLRRIDKMTYFREEINPVVYDYLPYKFL